MRRPTYLEHWIGQKSHNWFALTCQKHCSTCFIWMGPCKGFSSTSPWQYRVYSHDVRAAILVSRNNETKPCQCPIAILWELNPFLVQTLSLALINTHGCWPRESKALYNKQYPTKAFPWIVTVTQQIFFSMIQTNKLWELHLRVSRRLWSIPLVVAPLCLFPLDWCSPPRWHIKSAN